MTTPNLTTTATVKSVLHITEDSDDAIIDMFVAQASQAFTTEARRQFYATPGATLTYDIIPPQIYGGQLFFLEDVLGVDRVINGDGSVITPSEFRLLPVNSPSPKYALQLYVGANVWFQPTPDNNWQSAIQVQGTVGYCPTDQVPADVSYAVAKLAAYFYQTRDNTGDIIKFADGSTLIPANVPAVVLRTIENYKRVQMYT